MIPYSNMAPYRQLGPPAGCTWVDYVPRQSSIALREGAVWAAAAPVGDLPSLADCVEFLGQFGIAAAGAVGSVLLFSDLPFEELAAPARLRLTDESSSSMRLLYLLLLRQHGKDRVPLLAEPGEPAEAELLIGDEALVRAERPGRRFVIDLARKWFHIQRVPFVFARWVIRRDAPDGLRSAMVEWLQKVRERDAELAEQAAPAEAARLSITLEAMLAYLRGMKRVLGADELRGQELFLAELARIGTGRPFGGRHVSHSRAPRH
ncbi:MAG TPA: MqnA/MqnD/SBP family protein [Phycisphaerae bacterium]|nr:MqnA/MqnD/SBP family protein [Phycisphaerae bacterium]